MERERGRGRERERENEHRSPRIIFEVYFVD
jgi:hypothetical protein